MSDAKNWKDRGPLVSICCITYNHEAYIRDALEGFLMQRTEFPFEILIHDDASSDRTQEIIREYADRYPDVIKPILQTENQYSKGISNPSGAFNFPRVRGKYVAMCEGDDYWTDPDKLQRQVDYMERHPDCSLCFHSARIRTVDGSRSDRRMRPYRKSRTVTPEEMIDRSRGYAMASMVFRSDMIRQLPEYYVNCPVGDTPLQLMAASRGYGYYMDRDMSVYRIGAAASWTSQGKAGDYAAKQKEYCRQMRQTYLDFNRETGGRFAAEAKRAAARIWYLTMVNTRNYRVVLDPKYRRYYRELTARTRFYIRLETGLPGVYRFLAALAARRHKAAE